MSSGQPQAMLSFSDLGLEGPILKAVMDAGYKFPTPIQQEMIPLLLDGRDVIGQAQTGTGKTAAFALPILMDIKSNRDRKPQVLVLAPTRELAIQVADSFQAYAACLDDFTALPVFGGQDYTVQLKQLRRGVQVIVGTPGRVMDHIRRGSLDPAHIRTLVLDEADEMLRMGFLDDVEWILDKLPGRRQTALFSATMPENIRKIAHRYLDDPVHVAIDSRVVTAQTVNQRCLITSGGFMNKVETLSRILEAETYDGVLVFVRTKAQTLELAEQLTGLGYPVAPLNGDIQQSQRLRTIDLLKTKKIDILVATDVAARGLDVERISHVINFDIPFDTEAYIHRIGRTGRAGRSGEAILFVKPNEKAMLKSIERATRQKISLASLPGVDDINRKRIQLFKDRISSTLQSDTSFYQKLLQEYLDEQPVDLGQLAAALAKIAQGPRPLLMKEPDTSRKSGRRGKPDKTTAEERVRTNRKLEVQLPPEEGMERFRIELGGSDGIKPGNIVGAIANEADIHSRFIGRISIFDSYSTVDLPYGIPADVLRLLRKVRIGGKAMRMQRLTAAEPVVPDDRKPKLRRSGQKNRRMNKKVQPAAL
jgi:ATP-dependent RNA helicase DeaD